MALKSHLFNKNQALQACLVNDAAHITPGSKGEHVALVQSALVRLRYLSPESARKEATAYGTDTAKAVLVYKRQFDIVNRRYQTQADNIVGRMTIASLDHDIWVLDGGYGPPRMAGYNAPHPPSPDMLREQTARPIRIAAPSITKRTVAIREAAISGFKPPLAGLPPEIQAVIRRSNVAKIPGELLLYPFVAKHEGPLDDGELSKRFAEKPDAIAILQALFDRMRPFDIWKNIRIIIDVYTGVGAKGFFCEPFDHNAFFMQMKQLTTGPLVDPAHKDSALIDSKFCRDAFNVHGARDSFREIVKQGPGLHICIAQQAVRSNTSCDLHIDEIQQGQVCSKGVCIPIMNGQTIDHLITVGPWLVKESKIPLSPSIPIFDFLRYLRQWMQQK